MEFDSVANNGESGTRLMRHASWARKIGLSGSGLLLAVACSAPEAGSNPPPGTTPGGSTTGTTTGSTTGDMTGTTSGATTGTTTGATTGTTTGATTGTTTGAMTGAMTGTATGAMTGTSTGSGGMCEADTCQNGGFCTDSSGSAICICASGWTGADCSMPDCSGVTCANGGTCDATDSTPMCMCAEGWTGSDCTTPDCTGVTCAGEGTGTCMAGGADLSCVCDTGFQDNDGDLSCDTACDESTCGDFQVCDDAAGPASCECEPGYTGNDCLTCDTANSYEPKDGGPASGGTCERPSCLADGAYSFIDDFVDGGACWTTEGGTWSIVADGVGGSDGYQQGGTSSANVFAIAHPGPFADVRISARVKILSWNGTDSKDDFIGLYARYANSSDSYGAVLSSGNFLLTTDEGVDQKGSSLRVRENSDGQIPTDTWYTLTLEVTGDSPATIKATFHDGVTEHTVTNSSNAGTLAAGSLALGTTSGITAVFDDVTVTSLD